jgi:hypothetical protein
MIATAVSGAVAVAAGLAGSFIGRQTSAIVQRDSDERISTANAAAAKSNAAAAEASLKLEQLRREVGPRHVQREAFLQALEGKPRGHVEIVYLRDDPECFDVAQQLWHLLLEAHWDANPPLPIQPNGAAFANAVPTAMGVDGQPSGVTVVAHAATEAEMQSGDGRAQTPFTALTDAVIAGLGRGGASAGGVNRPPADLLRVVVAPR